MVVRQVQTLGELESSAPAWLRFRLKVFGSIEKRRPSALLTCANGHRFAIGRDHDIDALGRVAPKVGCPWDGCGWLEELELGAWAPA